MITEYLKPKFLNDALKVLKEREQKAALIAGGTNILLQIKSHRIKGRCWACQACTFPACPPYRLRPPELLISLNGLEELKFIKLEGNMISIGAGMTINTLIDNPLINQYVPFVIEAFKNVGYREIRNIATIGGNICNADPLADLIPPLLALDATLEIVSLEGRREQKLSSFIKNRNRVELLPMEIMTGVHLDVGRIRGVGYKRIATRQNGGRAIVIVAGILYKNDNKTLLRIGTSGLGIIAVYEEIDVTANQLDGKEIAKEIIYNTKVVKIWGSTPEYKKDMLTILIQDVINQCMEGAVD